MNLILLDQDDFVTDTIVELRDRRFRHLTEVLKAQLGKQCKAGLRNGLCGTAEVLTLDMQQGFARLQVQLATPPPPALDVMLVLALPRPKTLKKALHSAISYGVKEIHLIHSFKVDKSYWSTPLLSEDAFAPGGETYELMTLALEQAADTQMPKIVLHKAFKPFVEDDLPGLSATRSTYLAHPGVKRAFPARPQTPALLIIGPEGGFTDYEVRKLEEAHALSRNFGSHILRTEVALSGLLGRFVC